MTRFALLLALLGAVLVAAGVAWVYPPAGVITAGVEAIAVAYMIQYWEARR